MESTISPFNQQKLNYGDKIYKLIAKLFPLCRSITGEGVRKTLKILQNSFPLDIHEIPSGTQVFDWTVPKEWNIKDAYVKDSQGRKIVSFQDSNIHVLNYSVPVSGKYSLSELKDHLYTLPEYPDWIPYLTTYYSENWGFCLTHKQYEQLKDETYEVVIDSSLTEGSLTYGEYFIKGKTDDEVLITTYLCHPSLCNDNLSGVALTAFLAHSLKDRSDLKYSYRFLFIPETIGAICWLSQNEQNVSKIKHGLVVTCVGDPGSLTYKKSRIGDAEIDKIVEKVLQDSDDPYEIVDYFPSGSDERQFCSPGFNLPVGSLMRTRYGKFPEYHTSADNLDFVRPKYLGDTYLKYLQIIDILESDETYINLNPKCEPQLGKRGLYNLIGGQNGSNFDQLAMFWVLNLSDGIHSLLDIATRSGLKYDLIKDNADLLIQSGLLEKSE